MSVRQHKPSELVIAKTIWRCWQDPQPRDGFNMIVSRAADACGVTYDRAWWVACRTLNAEKGDWLFPCGGIGVKKL